MVKTAEATDHRLAQKIRIEHENLVSYFIPRGLLLERSAQKQLLYMTDSCIDRAHRFFCRVSLLVSTREILQYEWLPESIKCFLCC